jgi:hypothetical protein
VLKVDVDTFGKIGGMGHPILNVFCRGRIGCEARVRVTMSCKNTGSIYEREYWVTTKFSLSPMILKVMALGMLFVCSVKQSIVN